jgi:hypothetical protein
MAANERYRRTSVFRTGLFKFKRFVIDKDFFLSFPTPVLHTSDGTSQCVVGTALASDTLASYYYSY